jgi:hypothetical protein
MMKVRFRPFNCRHFLWLLQPTRYHRRTMFTLQSMTGAGHRV